MTTPETVPGPRSLEEILSEITPVDGVTSGDFEVLEDVTIRDKNNNLVIHLTKGEKIKIFHLHGRKAVYSGATKERYFIRKSREDQPGSIALSVDSSLEINVRML